MLLTKQFPLWRKPSTASQAPGEWRTTKGQRRTYNCVPHAGNPAPQTPHRGRHLRNTTSATQNPPVAGCTARDSSRPATPVPSTAKTRQHAFLARIDRRHLLPTGVNPLAAGGITLPSHRGYGLRLDLKAQEGQVPAIVPAAGETIRPRHFTSLTSDAPFLYIDGSPRMAPRESLERSPCHH